MENSKLLTHTPLTIQTAISCYVSNDPLGNVPFDWFSEPAKDARSWMKSEDLLQDEGTKLTDRGRAWVEAILATPLPVNMWTVGETKIVKLNDGFRYMVVLDGKVYKLPD